MIKLSGENVWRAAADGSHYDNVAQLDVANALKQKYGENIVQNEYSGGDLVREVFIKVDQNTLYWWLALKAAPINASTTTSTWSNKLRLTTNICAVIRIVFFIIIVVTSTGKFPH